MFSLELLKHGGRPHSCFYGVGIIFKDMPSPTENWWFSSPEASMGCLAPPP